MAALAALRRIRTWLWIFIVCLVLSGLTAFPLETETRWLADAVAGSSLGDHWPALAEWTVRVAEMRLLGTYNAIGPDKPLTIAEMLYGVKAVTTAGAQFTWVPWEFLQQQKVRPWRDMTVWQPPYGRTAGYQRRDASKAISHGLTFRPLAVTAKDTLDWHKTRPDAERMKTLNGEINGIGMKREAEVLAAW